MSNSDPKIVVEPIQAGASEALVHALRRRIGQIEEGRRTREDAALSSGCRALDRILPGRGFRRGTLVEWLSDGPASGAETLALVAAREACGKGGVLVVFDRARQFYPPAAVRLGIDPGDLIVVQATNRADDIWAMDQTLRCPGVAVVLAWPDGLTRAKSTTQEDLKTSGHGTRKSRRETLKGHDFRRFQLAAEEGGGLGLLVRPQDVQHEPSWADVRLLVEPLPASGRARRMRIRVLRCRGGSGGRAVEVEINDETHTVHSVSRLARNAVGRRAAGA